MSKSQDGFSEAEKAAMNERAKELKAEARANKKRSIGEQDVLEAIAAMSEHDRVLAERFHAIVSAAAPELWPKTWYGMPAYARDGKKVVCFFQAADKFEARYATFGFNDSANLDDGAVWPVSFAVTGFDDATEAMFTQLVKRAVS